VGGLIPNPNDMEVIDKLNARFSGAQLAALRLFMATSHDDTFNPSRHLHRISYRLKIYPTSGPRPRARWFVFLRDLIGAQVARSILAAIAAGVNDWDTSTTPPTGCVGLRFWAIYDPTMTVPPDYVADIDRAQPDANGQYWITITLRCFQEIDPLNPGIPDPTTPDGGENGGPQPLIGAAKKRAKKAAAKSSARKASKKAVKRPSKKASKRSAKKKK
jgi:hypothetical protein